MKSVTFFVAFLSFATTAFADLTDDVRCREIGFSKAVEARDAESFSSFIDIDARFISNSVTSGPVAITEAWAGFFADDGPLIKWRPQFVEVLKDGTLALTRGPYRMIVTDAEGNKVEGWGTFNSIWRRHDDGEWKVVFDAGNPAGAAPSAEVQALLFEEDNCEE